MPVWSGTRIQKNRLAINTQMFHTRYMNTAQGVTAGQSRTRRSYDSPRRRAMAEDTRAAVFAAAAELFATRGWAGTGMRDVARAAGVSVETVYATAGTKSDLLLRVIDIGVVGDDEPVPLADRPEFLAMGQGDRATRLAACGRQITASNQRIAALNRTFAQAAAGDADLAARFRESQQTQRSAYRDALRLILGRTPASDLVDGAWALGSHDVYLQLVESAGWTPRKYERWMVQRIGQLLAPIPKEKS
ncbi:MAG: TetR/AcrR family transcriptional regulator [Nocardioides sp.]|nr:TetR/AcrR family transcriptional regulator [Nocardioides sp.]